MNEIRASEDVNDSHMTAKGGNEDYRVSLISLGCAKNLVNSEQMSYLLTEAGYSLSADIEGAHTVIVNTCAFIDAAKTEAIDTILKLGEMKKEGSVGNIMIAGCLAQKYKDEIFVELPEVDAILGVGSFDRVAEAVEKTARTRGKVKIFDTLRGPVSEAKRIVSTPPAWSYLKIADGCDNRCAYCVIPDIRGPYRSRPIGNIVDEARELAERGTSEIIVIAQDVTRYGHDAFSKSDITVLLNTLCEIEKLKWIRLHYLYPDEITDELIDVIRESGKILKYLDIPIQHISDKILRGMNRRGSGDDIRRLIKKLRERIPGVVIRTSIITGLPGEGEEEFEELCDFLREFRIERAGIFAYSPQDGTEAAMMSRPDTETAESRAEILAELQSRIMDDFCESRIGKIETVLIEGFEDECAYGRSFAESPEIDGYIKVRFGEKNGRGRLAEQSAFIEVRITGAENGEPVGEPI